MARNTPPGIRGGPFRAATQLALVIEAAPEDGLVPKIISDLSHRPLAEMISCRSSRGTSGHYSNVIIGRSI